MVNSRMAWLLVLGVAGCMSSSSKATCEDEQGAARDKVFSVITSHLTCTVDTDCVVVTAAASCFDSCTQVVAASAKADVQAAIDDVDAHECKTANDDGCTFIPPPCAAPQAPTCAAGMCR